MSKNNSFNGKIYCSFETSMLLPPLLKDSAHISEFEAEHIGDGVHPLYEQKDIISTMDKVEACELNKDICINENVYFRFIQNSHIVGSVQIIMFFRTPSNVVKKLCFTGDIGNVKFKKHYVKDIEYCNTCNAFFIESTYGRNNKSITKKERKEDLKIIKDTVKEIKKSNSRLLIPVFGQDRLQQILTVLYELYKDDAEFNIDVVVDSKLGIDINNVYKKILIGDDLELFNNVLAWDRIKFIRDGNESKACATDKASKIILSTSGFGDAGRITAHLKDILPSDNDYILFCGYSSPQSTSGKIRNSETIKLKIGNNFVKKSCNVRELSSFSSHMQQDDLISYMKHVNTERIILVHGDKEAKNDLRDKAVEELHKIGKTSKIVYGEKGMEIYI